MPSPCCQEVNAFFTRRTAVRDLRYYRRWGPRRSTRLLIDALVSEGVEAYTLLDIGGGIGALQHGLFEADLARAVSVDASVEYMRAAQEESLRLGTRARTSMYHGDFVALQDRIEQADIVTLDRVLCCYRDLTGLMSASASKVKKLYGLVFPRSTALARAAVAAFNALCWLRGLNFRNYDHDTGRIHDLAVAAGLSRIFSAKTLLWEVSVYRRGPEP